MLEILQGHGITAKKAAATDGGEWESPCPSCQGSDRFRIWPEKGRFWCRGCNIRGDKIDLYRLFNPNYTYPEACRAIGEVPKPLADREYHRPRPTWTPTATPDPRPPSWQEKAAALVEWAHKELLADPARLARLSSCRGLSLESVKRFRLGWNPSDLYQDRAEWGLSLELRDDGKPKRLWIPTGLVIPTFRAGVVVRVQVRRPEGEPRYVFLPGSSTEPATVGEGTTGAVIVESELDAFLIAQEAGDLVAAVAIRSATSKPDQGTHALFTDGRAILIALDGDEAGAKAAWGFWHENYPAAIRWPVPMGKDPTEAWKADIPIRAWVVEGLLQRMPLAKEPRAISCGEIREIVAAACKVACQMEKGSPALSRLSVLMDGALEAEQSGDQEKMRVAMACLVEAIEEAAP